MNIERRFLEPVDGNLTTDLPDAALNTENIIWVLNIAISTSPFNVIVIPQPGQQINRAASFTVTSNRNIMCVSDGSNWWAIRSAAAA